MLLIGIAGGTGCGKTTLVNQLRKELPSHEVGVISQDSYYHDLSHLPLAQRRETNFDHPDAIDFKLLEKHLFNLKNGDTIEQPVYSFKNCTRTKQTAPIIPTKIIFVEGILVLSNAAIRKALDLKIFIHADADERLIRRLRRDILERNWNLTETLENYQTLIKPMHEQFIEPSKEYADMIVLNNASNTDALGIIRSYIHQHLRDL